MNYKPWQGTFGQHVIVAKGTCLRKSFRYRKPFLDTWIGRGVAVFVFLALLYAVQLLLIGFFG